MGDVIALQEWVASGAAMEFAAGEEDSNTLLHWAALHGQLEIVRLLVQCGASINAQNKVQQ